MAQPRRNFDSAVQMYVGGLSIGEVAAIFGVSRQSMWETLNRRGVKFRPQKRLGKDNVFHRGGTINGKRQARMAIQLATDKGVLKRGATCEACGASGIIEGHHDDYNEPLVVRWLCKKCHYDWHTKNKAVPLHG